MKKILLIVVALLAVICTAIFIYKYKLYDVKGALEKQKDKNSSMVIDKNEAGITFGNSYAQIVDYISGSDNYMLVVGQEKCSFCDMYKPVLEEISKLYKFNYMYVDVKNLSDEDMSLFFSSEILIPGKCHNSGIDSHLSDGFSTPLTLFIKDKTSYDCIRGYVNKDSLIFKLKEISFIN